MNVTKRISMNSLFRSILMFTPVLFLFSCSSISQKAPRQDEGHGEERTFKPTFELISAQMKRVPQWIENPQYWAHEFDSNDFPEYRYFTYTTEPKKLRSLACDLARAKASEEIAHEMTQFIKSSFGHSLHGNPTENDTRLDEYVESTLAQEIKSFIVGAEIYRTYWEERSYRKKLGAENDFRGHVCSVLVKMKKENVRRAIERAQRKLERVTSSNKVKDMVKKALSDADKEFNDQAAGETTSERVES